MQNTGYPIAVRVNSVDFSRGITIFLLAGKSTQLYGQFIRDDLSGFVLHHPIILLSLKALVKLRIWERTPFI